MDSANTIAQIWLEFSELNDRAGAAFENNLKALCAEYEKKKKQKRRRPRKKLKKVPYQQGISNVLGAIGEESSCLGSDFTHSASNLQDSRLNTTELGSTSSGRVRRLAAQEASTRVQKQLSMNLIQKMRNEENTVEASTSNFETSVSVKEKISRVLPVKDDEDLSLVNIKLVQPPSAGVVSPSSLGGATSTDNDSKKTDGAVEETLSANCRIEEGENTAITVNSGAEPTATSSTPSGSDRVLFIARSPSAGPSNPLAVGSHIQHQTRGSCHKVSSTTDSLQTHQGNSADAQVDLNKVVIEDVTDVDIFNAKEESCSTESKPANSVFKVPRIVLTKVEFNKETDSKRPSRVRTKNKKYENDNFVTTNNAPKKESSVEQSNSQPVPNSLENSPSKRGMKRKSGSGSHANSKSKALKSNDLEENLPPSMAECSSTKALEESTATKPAVVNPSTDFSTSKRLQSSDNRSSTSNQRTRTKVLEKPTLSDISYPKADSSTSSQSIHLEAGPSCRTRLLDKPTLSNAVYPEVGLIPPNQNTSDADSIAPRTPKTSNVITRSRTKDTKKKNGLLCVQGLNTKNMNINHILSSLKKTPQATKNTMISPTSFMPRTPLTNIMKAIDNTSLKKVVLKTHPQKNAVVDNKRHKKEKELRYLANLENIERKKEEKLAKLKIELQEKEKKALAAKKLREEKMLQKKQVTNTMMKEAEERRQREEEAKLARIRKLEEEKKKQEEERVRQINEAKKLHELRLQEEAKEKERKLKEALKKKASPQEAASSGYQMTPDRSEAPPKKPKSENDYGLSDIESGDSTDDEGDPKKIVPKWALKEERNEVAFYVQSQINRKTAHQLMPLHLNIEPLSVTNKRCRARMSSAVWDTSSPHPFK